MLGEKSINPKKSSIRHSTSSTSLLSRTRKISSELPRPLKRASSLSYRIFTPTQMVIPTGIADDDKNISNLTPASTAPPSYVKKIRKRFGSIRRKASSTSLINTSSLSLSSNLSSPVEGFTCENFEVNNLISPPSSPPGTSSENDEEVEEFDTSAFSHSSDLFDTKDISFNATSSSCETSPASKRKLRFKPFLNELTDKKNIFLNDLDNALTKKAYGDNDYDMEFYNDYVTEDNNASSHLIFEIPEILEIILRYVAHDYVDTIPTEPKMSRRPPLSYNHSLLMYGEEQGKRVWGRMVSDSSIKTSESLKSNAKTLSNNPNLYSCLLVSKTWNSTMLSILNENLYFKTDSEFENFTSCMLSKNSIESGNAPQPFSLVMHKIRTPQSILDVFSTQISPRRLSWLEFYICPTTLPPLNLVTQSLKKLVLPGCKQLTDDHLKLLISKAPKLNYLDIRACDQITDSSLYFIGQNCKNLEILNCGRHKRGELITDVSIGAIAKNCPIRTIGLAGCGISDWTIWEIALNCGKTLERLSVNHCWKLSDLGICRVLKAGLLENLSVLEIRGLRLNNVGEIVYWKKRRSQGNFKVLIEACETIDTMLQNTENEINSQINSRILGDIHQWLDQSEDENDGGDVDYRAFLSQRSIRIV